MGAKKCDGWKLLTNIARHFPHVIKHVIVDRCIVYHPYIRTTICGSCLSMVVLEDFPTVAS